jgi:hypothetical protein
MERNCHSISGEKGMFQTIDPEAAQSGKYSDVCFAGTMEVLGAKKMDG